MTPAQIRARIETASARLLELQSDLEEKEALLRAGRDVNGDGVVDERDIATVERVRTRALDAQGRIDTLLSELIRAEALADDVPVTEIDFEDAAIVNIPGGADRRPFSQGKNAFKTQINIWRVDVRESLGRMVNSMLSDSGSAGPSFPRGDIVGLARTALTSAGHPEIATALGVANSLLNIALVAYEASLPSTPSLREIETKWRDAIDSIDDSVAESTYDELVQVFRDFNNMESNEEYLYSTFYAQWDALIDGFRAGNVLPSSNSINRAFMAHIIAEMPDDTWDMNWTSGEVLVFMEFDMDSNEFSFSSGSIDDITTEVNRGLKADPNLFGAGGVIALPTPIRFRISGSSWSDGTYCELYRRSTTSGSTEFNLIPIPINVDTSLEEQGTLFQIFMRRRIYSTVSVRQVLD